MAQLHVICLDTNERSFHKFYLGLHPLDIFQSPSVLVNNTKQSPLGWHVALHCHLPTLEVIRIVFQTSLLATASFNRVPSTLLCSCVCDEA